METLKTDVEEQLGFKVEDRQFQKSLHHARKKLCFIISRYGDADGRRREPEYLQELICEDIKASVLAEATMLMAVKHAQYGKRAPDKLSERFSGQFLMCQTCQKENLRKHQRSRLV